MDSGIVIIAWAGQAGPTRVLSILNILRADYDERHTAGVKATADSAYSNVPQAWQIVCLRVLVTRQISHNNGINKVGTSIQTKFKAVSHTEMQSDGLSVLNGACDQ